MVKVLSQDSDGSFLTTFTYVDCNTLFEVCCEQGCCPRFSHAHIWYHPTSVKTNCDIVCLQDFRRHLFFHYLSLHFRLLVDLSQEGGATKQDRSDGPPNRRSRRLADGHSGGTRQSRRYPKLLNQVSFFILLF